MSGKQEILFSIRVIRRCHISGLQRFYHQAMATTFEVIIVNEDDRYAGQASAAGPLGACCRPGNSGIRIWTEKIDSLM